MRRASISSRRSLRATVRKRAERLAREPAIVAAAWGLRSGALPHAGLSIDDLARELEQARALAIAKGHSAAAVSATLGKAKLYGLPLDRKGTASADIESMTDAELDAYIARLLAELQGETDNADLGALKTRTPGGPDDA